MTWVNWSRNTATFLVGLSRFLPVAHAQQLDDAVFGGGCFWCMEETFEKIRGVKSVDSGYTGGRTPSPTYEQVSPGNTGHVEVVRVQYDPQQVSYRTPVKGLLDQYRPHSREPSVL